jgi:L-ribulose-5-phosphate 3-epimerase
MFKKAVITDEISQDFRTAVGLALEYSLEGVEIRSVAEKGPHELEAPDIRAMKAVLGDAGLSVCAISAPFFKCGIDEPAAEQLDILRRCADLAHALGATLVRGFTFWRKGDFEAELPRIVSRFTEPCEILERESLTLALEFDENINACNARRLARVIEAVGSPRVKALWDPANDLEDPEGEEPFPAGYEIIKPHMVHVHLKDGKRMPDGSVSAVALGTGDMDYPAVFRRLMRDRYEGWVVLETHYRPARPLDGRLLALPKGSAFSHLGYEATEECLANWDEIMRTI